MEQIKLKDLKSKSPTELLALAEENDIENASTMRKQDMMFAILKELAEQGVFIIGEGVVEVLPDGFGFLRSPDANYLPGPDDIYVSPSQIRRFSLRTGDTVEGDIRSPKDGERYFALLKVNSINFEDPDKIRHKVNFDNLTPLYPEERILMEFDNPAEKDRSSRIIDIVAPLGKGQRALIVSPPKEVAVEEEQQESQASDFLDFADLDVDYLEEDFLEEDESFDFTELDIDLLNVNFFEDLLDVLELLDEEEDQASSHPAHSPL